MEARISQKEPTYKKFSSVVHTDSTWLSNKLDNRPIFPYDHQDLFSTHSQGDF